MLQCFIDNECFLIVIYIYPNINDDECLKDLDMTTSIERLQFRVLFKRELLGIISMAASAFPPNKIADICCSVNSLKTNAQVTLCIYICSYDNTYMY